MNTGFWWADLLERDYSQDRYRWEDNIKMDFREMGQEDVDCIALAQNRDRCRVLVNAVMNLWVPQKPENFLTR